MRRRIFTAMSVVSGVLCVTVCLLWLRGHYKHDAVVRFAPTSQWNMDNWRSEITLQFDRILRLNSPTTPRWIWNTDASDSLDELWEADVFTHSFQAPGIRYGYMPGDARDPGSYVWVGLSHWLLAILTAILPICWLIAYFRRHRPGHCRSCGYDLRGSEGA
jgi:hypothetical protein